MNNYEGLTGLYEVQANRKSNLVQEVMKNISRMIGELKLKPGDRMPTEAELCEIMNVSRAVVREAIAGLTAIGMVETRQGHGNIVLDFTNSLVKPHPLFINADLESILEVIEVRRIFEVEVARITAIKRSEEDMKLIEKSYLALVTCDNDNIEEMALADLNFHMTLAYCTKNRFLYRFLSNMTDILKSTIIESFRENPGSLEKAMREHEQVVQAIRIKDPQKAYEAMSTHLSITEARLKEDFKFNPKMTDIKEI